MNKNISEILKFLHALKTLLQNPELRQDSKVIVKARFLVGYTVGYILLFIINFIPAYLDLSRDGIAWDIGLQFAWLRQNSILFIFVLTIPILSAYALLNEKHINRLYFLRASPLSPHQILAGYTGAWLSLLVFIIMIHMPLTLFLLILGRIDLSFIVVFISDFIFTGLLSIILGFASALFFNKGKQQASMILITISLIVLGNIFLLGKLSQTELRSAEVENLLMAHPFGTTIIHSDGNAIPVSLHLACYASDSISDEDACKKYQNRHYRDSKYNWWTGPSDKLTEFFRANKVYNISEKADNMLSSLELSYKKLKLFHNELLDIKTKLKKDKKTSYPKSRDGNLDLAWFTYNIKLGLNFISDLISKPIKNTPYLPNKLLRKKEYDKYDLIFMLRTDAARIKIFMSRYMAFLGSMKGTMIDEKVINRLKKNYKDINTAETTKTHHDMMELLIDNNISISVPLRFRLYFGNADNYQIIIHMTTKFIVLILLYIFIAKNIFHHVHYFPHYITTIFTAIFLILAFYAWLPGVPEKSLDISSVYTLGYFTVLLLIMLHLSIPMLKINQLKEKLVTSYAPLFLAFVCCIFVNLFLKFDKGFDGDITKYYGYEDLVTISYLFLFVLFGFEVPRQYLCMKLSKTWSGIITIVFSITIPLVTAEYFSEMEKFLLLLVFLVLYFMLWVHVFLTRFKSRGIFNG